MAKRIPPCLAARLQEPVKLQAQVGGGNAGHV